ncbi:FAD/NAD(P)-binding domain-containing protein, partial [Meira miltonrushii]
RTVLVLGASYGGHHAAQVLVTQLPQNWRVVVIERNTHYNHLYAFPRVSVVPGHEEKVFIPYTKLFQPPSERVTSSNNELIHGVLKSLGHRESEQSEGRGVARYIPIDETYNPNSHEQSQIRTIAFDYMIFALGSILPAPINTWSVPSGKLDDEASKILQNGKAGFWGGKQRGVKWLRETQDRIAAAESILIIGGGALGVQYASDIAWMYGTATSSPKKITENIESLLPRFQDWMHENATAELEKLGVEIHTGARADLSTLDETPNGKKRVIKTTTGKEIDADLVLFCTGQRPNTDFLAGFATETGKEPSNPFINPSNGSAYVTPTLQLTLADRKPNPELQHIFVIGDAADAYGALNAGHTAFSQGHVAAENIAKLVYDQEIPGFPQPLQAYEVESHKIKVSVGLDRAINENTGNHKVIEGGKVDLNTPGMWTRRGLDVSDL